MNFTAIDFETATGNRNSACAVGIVTVEGGEIVEQYSTLMKPPDNEYSYRTIAVHGIRPADTADAPTFAELYPEIHRLLHGRTLVAHNESFDRSVLKGTMAHYGLDYAALELADRWECTVRINRAKGHRPNDLATCCARSTTTKPFPTPSPAQNFT
jgi:DNA polymerase-3 subunit epsilon